MSYDLLRIWDDMGAEDVVDDELKEYDLFDHILNTLTSDHISLNQKLRQLCELDSYLSECKALYLKDISRPICEIMFPYICSILSTSVAKVLHKKFSDTIKSILLKLCLKRSIEHGYFENRLLKIALTYTNLQVSIYVLDILVEILTEYVDRKQKIIITKNNVTLIFLTISKLLNNENEKLIKIYNIVELCCELDSSSFCPKFVNLMDVSMKLYSNTITSQVYVDLRTPIKKFIWKMSPYFIANADFISCVIIQLYNDSLDNFHKLNNADLFDLLLVFIDSLNLQGNNIFSATIYQFMITLLDSIYTHVLLPNEIQEKHSLLFYHLKLLNNVLGYKSINLMCHGSLFNNFFDLDNTFNSSKDPDPSLLITYLKVCEKICKIFPQFFHSLHMLDTNAYKICLNSMASTNNIKDDMFQLTALIFIDNNNSTIKFLNKLMYLITSDTYSGVSIDKHYLEQLILKFDLYFQVFTKFYPSDGTFSILINSHFFSDIINYYHLSNVECWNSVNSPLYEEIIMYLTRFSKNINMETLKNLSALLGQLISDKNIPFKLSLQLLYWCDDQLLNTEKVVKSQRKMIRPWVQGVLRLLSENDFNNDNQYFLLSILLKFLRSNIELDKEIYLKIFNETVASLLFTENNVTDLAICVLSFIPFNVILKVTNHREFISENIIKLRNAILQNTSIVLQTKYLKNVVYKASGINGFTYSPELFMDDTTKQHPNILPDKFDAFILYLWKNVASIFNHQGLCDIIPRLLNNIENLLLKWISKYELSSHIYLHFCIILQTVDFLERISLNIKYESHTLHYMASLTDKVTGEPLDHIVFEWMNKNRKYLFKLCIRFKLLHNAFYYFSSMVNHHVDDNNDESISHSIFNVSTKLNCASTFSHSTSSLNSNKEKNMIEYGIMLLNEIILHGDREFCEDLIAFFQTKCKNNEWASLATIIRLINDSKFILFTEKLLQWKQHIHVKELSADLSSFSIESNSNTTTSNTTKSMNRRITLAKNFDKSKPCENYMPEQPTCLTNNRQKNSIDASFEKLFDIQATNITLKYVNMSEMFPDFCKQLDDEFHYSKLNLKTLYNWDCITDETIDENCRMPILHDNVIFEIYHQNKHNITTTKNIQFIDLKKLIFGHAICDYGNPDIFLIVHMLLHQKESITSLMNESVNLFNDDSNMRRKFLLDKMSYLSCNIADKNPVRTSHGYIENDSSFIRQWNSWMFDFCIENEIYCFNMNMNNRDKDKNSSLFDIFLLPDQKQALLNLFYHKKSNDSLNSSILLNSPRLFLKLMKLIRTKSIPLEKSKFNDNSSITISSNISKAHENYMMNSCNDIVTFTNHQMFNFYETLNMYSTGLNSFDNHQHAAGVWFDVGTFLSDQHPLKVNTSDELYNIFKNKYPDCVLLTSIAETRFKQIFVDLKKSLFHLSLIDYANSTLSRDEIITKLLLPLFVENNVDMISFVTHLIDDTLKIQQIILYVYCQFVLSRSSTNQSIPMLVLSTLINLLLMQCNHDFSRQQSSLLYDCISILREITPYIWKNNLDDIISILLFYKRNDKFKCFTNFKCSFLNKVLDFFENIIYDFLTNHPNDIIMILISKFLSAPYYDSVFSSGFSFNYIKSLLEQILSNHCQLFDESILFCNSVTQLAPAICEQSYEYFRHIEHEIEKVDAYFEELVDQFHINNHSVVEFTSDQKLIIERVQLSLWLPIINLLNKLLDYYCVKKRNSSPLSKNHFHFLSSIHVHVSQLKNIIKLIYTKNSRKNYTVGALLKYLMDQLHELILSVNGFIQKRPTKCYLLDYCPKIVLKKFERLTLSSKTSPHGYIEVASIMAPFKVLNSKTKPKQLKLITSSGHLVKYLLKGGENMNTDRHVACVIFGVCELDKFLNCSSNISRLNPYQIIPVGNNCGLVEYLSNPIPIYQLYNKCLEAKRSHHLLYSSSSQLVANSSSLCKTISHDNSFSDNHFVKSQRVVCQNSMPKGIYGKKLAQIVLRYNECIDLNDRASLPIPLLKEVYNELCEEFPDNLIQKELFMACNNACQYINVQRLFIKSCSTMNVLGFVVGLGDRHLGNILLNFSNGFITHIDFNVCFDRGKLLSVPENVPFRLTRNFVKAFGSFGCSGNYTYNSSCLLEFVCNHHNLIESYLCNQYFGDCSEWSYNHRLSLHKSLKNTLANGVGCDIISYDTATFTSNQSSSLAKLNIQPNNFYSTSVVFITIVIQSIATVIHLNDELFKNSSTYKCIHEKWTSRSNKINKAPSSNIIHPSNSISIKDGVFNDFRQLLEYFLKNYLQDVASSNDLAVMSVAWVLLSGTDYTLDNKNKIFNNKLNVDNYIQEWSSCASKDQLYTSLQTMFNDTGVDNEKLSYLFEILNPEICSQELMKLQSQYMDISSKQRRLAELLPSLQNQYSVITLKMSSLYEGMPRKSSVIMGCCAFLRMYKQQIISSYSSCQSKETHFLKNSGMLSLTNYGRLIGYVNIILRFLMNSDTDLNMDASLSFYVNLFGEFPKLFSLYEGFYYTLKTNILPTLQHRYISLSKDFSLFNKKFSNVIAENHIYKEMLSWDMEKFTQNLFTSQPLSNEYYLKENSVEEFYCVISNIYDNTFCGFEQPYHTLFDGILTLFNCINSTVAIIQDSDQSILNGLRKLVLLFKVVQVKFWSKFSHLNTLFDFLTVRRDNNEYLLDQRIWTIDIEFIDKLQQILSDTLDILYNEILVKVVTTHLLDHVECILLSYVNISSSSIERIIQSDINKIKNNFQSDKSKNQRKTKDHLVYLANLVALWAEIDTLKIYNIQLSSIMKECDIINYQMFRYMFLKQFLSPKVTFPETIVYLNKKCPSLTFSDGIVQMLNSMYKLKLDVENSLIVNDHSILPLDTTLDNIQHKTDFEPILSKIKSYLTNIHGYFDFFNFNTESKWYMSYLKLVDTKVELEKSIQSITNYTDLNTSSTNTIECIYNNIQQLLQCHFDMLDISLAFVEKNNSDDVEHSMDPLNDDCWQQIKFHYDDSNKNNHFIDDIISRIDKLYIQDIHVDTSINRSNLITVVKRLYHKLTAESIRKECEVKSRPFSYEKYAKILNKNAQNVSNLCKMYEGWTPWI